MKKLKKMWQENSILFVLFFILLACLIAIMVVVITYFIGNSKGKLGDRVENKENYPIKAEEIISKMKQDETIEEVTIHAYVRTIYVKITFQSDVKLTDAKSKTQATLEYFDKELQGYYDIEFDIEAKETEKTEGFAISGSHNASGTGGIEWNNNTKFETDEKE